MTLTDRKPLQPAIALSGNTQGEHRRANNRQTGFGLTTVGLKRV
jgi:hypothetical protein